jgi:hypothetical protein
MLGIDGIPLKPTKFIFATARHAAVDLTQSFGIQPVSPIRKYTRADFTRLCTDFAAHGIDLPDTDEVWQHLRDLRLMYEPFVEALADYLLVTLPDMDIVANRVDDWQTSGWDHFLPSSPRELDRAIRNG